MLGVCRGSWLLACRPHVHRVPCIVCDGDSSLLNHQTHLQQQLRPLSLLSSSNGIPATQKGKASPSVVKRALVRNDGNTVEEKRRCGLLQWLEYHNRASSHRLLHGNQENTHQSSWEAFNDTSLSLTNDILDGATCYLNAFCVRCYDSRDASATTVVEDERVVIPDTTKIVNSCPTFPSVQGKASRNDFLDVLRTKELTPEEMQKQLNFQQALLHLQSILWHDLHVPFFLACGTALGVHREGHFIKSDDDIDVGVFYEDLVALGSEDSETAVSDTVEFKGSAGAVSLMKAISASGDFVVFDICGTVSRGLEVRLLHVPTQVRIDINLYYPPIEPEDDDIVKEKGHFLWTATHYGESEKRKFGMYRYLHQTLHTPLESLPFCAMSRDCVDTTFLVPSESYLSEYFGNNWRFPRQYTYEQGLSGEYKNIIDE